MSWSSVLGEQGEEVTEADFLWKRWHLMGRSNVRDGCQRVMERFKWAFLALFWSKGKRALSQRIHKFRALMFFLFGGLFPCIFCWWGVSCWHFHIDPRFWLANSPQSVQNIFLIPHTPISSVLQEDSCSQWWECPFGWVKLDFTFFASFILKRATEENSNGL